MFSVSQKRLIAAQIQQILRETQHPELPAGEIRFELRVIGADALISWAVIHNNGSVRHPVVNPWNEAQDPASDYLKTAKAKP